MYWKWVILSVAIVILLMRIAIVKAKHKKEMKSFYGVDKIIKNGIIKKFPEKILIENASKDSSLYSLSWDVDFKFKELSLKCFKCKTIFNLNEVILETNTNFHYVANCTYCKMKYTANVYVDNTRNNSIVLVIDKSDI